MRISSPKTNLELVRTKRDDSSSDSSTKGKNAKDSDRRREAEKFDFPPLPTIPGYAVWLEEVMRAVLGGSGAPLDALAWWHNINGKTAEQLAESGKFV